MSGSGSGSERSVDRPGRAFLELLGLATRARGVVAGTDSVRQAVREGKARRVVLAADTAPTQQAKLLPLLAARGVPHHLSFTQEELGAAMGRGAVAAIGFTDASFARRAGELIAARQDSRSTAEP